ncbi:MAG TPA: class I SAM-dependent methyltransferase [Polyangiaceae bacterium]|nr:class I SAM-dependent methyltransferase [Polyangiaceae bacterium]
MSATTIAMTEQLHEYLLRTTVREPELLGRLRKETLALPNGGMQISPEQGQLMSLLVQLIGAQRTLEVGVFTGYSSTVVAMALPADGKLVACDVSEEWTSIARRFWREAGVESKIELYVQPAVATLDALLGRGEAGRFDFAFIDADKESYDAYYERCLALLRPGGLIAVDNVLWSGAVAEPANQRETTLAIRALNAKVADDSRVTSSLLPIGDGLYLARKR